MNNEQIKLWNNLKEDNTLNQIQEYIKKVIEIRDSVKYFVVDIIKEDYFVL